MSLAPGSRLGQYEIVNAIGAGGMGEVYRARDPRLDREVAIKVLSKALSNDPVAVARFEREATSVAKLSHPNILSIFEFGRDQGAAFVAMELIDGETLRARLQSGPLPARRAAGYAQQIARGIAAAHARGIVHRDLKPENVMITRDDQVKILDFGLAKPLDMGGSDETRGPSLATSAGTVLGTFGYMAPEQVRGQAVDQRADMFAFGAVLYEMLCGERAFKAETPADTMTAILTKEPPDLDLAKLSISPGLDKIVRRCLEKSAELRFQSANDLAFALETLTGVSTSSGAAAVTAAPVARARGTALPWIVAATAVVAAAAWSLGFAGSGAPPAESRWNTFTRVTDAAGDETAPTLSPDGNTVAYAVRVNNSWDIYGQRVGGRNATPIVADPQRDEGAPAYSPDGTRLAFHESDSDGGIFVAGATGESVRRLTSTGFDPSWSPDGKSIAFATEAIDDPSSRLSQSALYVVDAAGGTPRKVADGDAVEPSWSPAGDRIVYFSNTGGQRDIYTVAAAGGPRVPVTNDPAIDWSPVWSPDSRHIYFSSDRGGTMNLWRIAIDASSGRTSGVPEPVTVGVQAASALPSFSKDGLRLAFRSRVASTNPVAIPFDSATLRAGVPVLLDARNNIRVPTDVSPDGKSISYFSIGERQEDIFVGSLNGSMRRVTDDEPRDRAPQFTPDGRSLVFYSTRGGSWGIWMVGVDGGNLRQVTAPSGGGIYPMLSPRGDTVIFSSTASQTFSSMPFGGDGQATPVEVPRVLVGGLAFTPLAWSPDGNLLAGQLVTESGRPGGVATYDLTTKAATGITPDETYYVRWLADSRRVVYFTKNGWELVVVDIATRKRTVIDVRLPGRATADTFALAPDNRAIYFGAVRSEADIWIMEKK